MKKIQITGNITGSQVATENSNLEISNSQIGNKNMEKSKKSNKFLRWLLGILGSIISGFLLNKFRGIG